MNSLAESDAPSDVHDISEFDHRPEDAAVTSADPGPRARFLQALTAARPGVGTPNTLCEACMSVLPVRRVGITITSDDGIREFLAASDAVAERLEWAQIMLGEGPGVDAEGGESIAVHDVATTASPWPVFAKEAAAVGVSVVCVLPLQLGTIRVGVLTLYLSPQTVLGVRQFADAIAIADLITSILISGGTIDVQHPLDHWWDQPLAAREIHQATGMLVAQFGITAREAYIRLRSYAFAHDRPLADAARDIVHRGLRIGEDPDSRR